MKKKKLYEVEHPYYATEGNYYKNGWMFEYESWEDFLKEMGDADLDMNLIYRWDWTLPEKPNEDIYYRDGKLNIFYIQQRKARCMSHHIKVCKADEPEIRKWLALRYKHLLKVWKPYETQQP